MTSYAVQSALSSVIDRLDIVRCAVDFVVSDRLDIVRCAVDLVVSERMTSCAVFV